MFRTPLPLRVGGELAEQGIDGDVEAARQRGDGLPSHRTPSQANREKCRAHDKAIWRSAGIRLALAPATDRALIDADLNRQGMELANLAPLAALVKALARMIDDQLRGCSLVRSLVILVMRALARYIFPIIYLTPQTTNARFSSDLEDSAMSNAFVAAHFQSPETAREWLEKLRWPEGPVCSHCGTIGHAYKTKKPGWYRCAEKECRKDFTVTTGRSWSAAIFR